MLDAKTNKIAAVNIEIDFDYTKVKLASEVIVGTALPKFADVMAQANASGKLIIHLGKTPGGTNDPTGTFGVATIIWTPATTQTNQTTQVTVNTATSQVTDNSDPANPQYVPITATPLSVIINPVATPTPRPSLTSTPTPRPTNTPTPRPTNTPTPRPTNTPTPRPSITLTPTPRPSITLTPTLRPTNTPTPRPTATFTPTPKPSNSPTPWLTTTTTPTLTPRPTSVKPTPTPKPQILTFTAIEDKTITRKHSSKNLSQAESLLRVGGSRVNNFLVKFNVSGLSEHRIVSVKLRLYGKNLSTSGGKFYTTTNDWNEETVTWDNAPKAFTYLGRLGFIRPGRWYEVNVMKFVTGDGLLLSELRLQHLRGGK